MTVFKVLELNSVSFVLYMEFNYIYVNCRYFLMSILCSNQLKIFYRKVLKK